MYVCLVYVCMFEAYIHTRSNIHAQTYTLEAFKHTLLRASNIHTYIHDRGIQTYIHDRGIQTYMHTYTLERFKHTYIHTYMLEGFSKVPPLTQDRKSEQECSRRAFSSVFSNPKLFCEIRHTFIHA